MKIDWKFEIFRIIFGFLIAFGILFGIGILSKCSQPIREKEYAETLYEIEILDKYDYIGSSWHLIGGRASEQEYHVVYKVTPITEEAKKKYYGDTEEDTEVSYTKYRKINVGQKFTGSNPYIGAYIH